jgi:prolyl-tRNA editing enzyme YbaK/EbsC (Cys-tRNA(Pro) deacylase)
LQLQETLSRFGIQFEIINHSSSGKTTNDAVSALNESPKHIIKSLLLKSKNGNFVGIIIRGDTRVDFKKVEEHFTSNNQLGYKKFRLATPEEVEKYLSYKIGGVPPFAFYKKFPVIFDPAILTVPYVIGAAGNEFTGIKFNPQELKKFGYVEKECSLIPPANLPTRKLNAKFPKFKTRNNSRKKPPNHLRK